LFSLTHSSGVYFNDSTKAVLDRDGETFQYIERRKPMPGSGDSIKRQTEPVVETHTLASFPESLQKKVTLLKHFHTYLLEQQQKDGEDCVYDASDDSAEESSLPLVYLKKWVRTKHAVLFRLSDQTVQIVFYDQTEVLLTPDERYLTYVDKKRNRCTYFLSNELVASNPELAKRLRYSKEILNTLLSGQKR
jgi:polo-like kinase 1